MRWYFDEVRQLRYATMRISSLCKRFVIVHFYGMCRTNENFFVLQRNFVLYHSRSRKIRRDLSHRFSASEFVQWIRKFEFCIFCSLLREPVVFKKFYPLEYYPWDPELLFFGLTIF